MSPRTPTRSSLRISQLDWTLTAIELERVVRVGGAWTTFRDHRLKVWRALAHDDTADLVPGQIEGDRVGTGAVHLELIEVQAEGKPRRTADDWLHGARPTSDDRLGE